MIPFYDNNNVFVKKTELDYHLNFQKSDLDKWEYLNLPSEISPVKLKTN